MDASGKGVEGVIVGENIECVPTVYRMEWPGDMKRELKTKKNHATRSVLGVSTGTDEVTTKLRRRYDEITTKIRRKYDEVTKSTTKIRRRYDEVTKSTTKLQRIYE